MIYFLLSRGEIAEGIDMCTHTRAHSHTHTLSESAEIELIVFSHLVSGSWRCAQMINYSYGGNVPKGVSHYYIFFFGNDAMPPALSWLCKPEGIELNRLHAYHHGRGVVYADIESTIMIRMQLIPVEFA